MASKMNACLYGTPLENSKHEHFAHLVVKGETAAKAYVLCGYSEKGAIQSGNRLFRKPEVAGRIQELKTAVSERQVEKVAVDRTWVLAKLVENVQRAMQVEPVRDREGNAIGQYTYQGGVANKALELLGKELGMFQPRQENTESRAKNIMDLLEAGRKRVAEAKRKRDVAESVSNNLHSPESKNDQIVAGDNRVTSAIPEMDAAC